MQKNIYPAYPPYNPENYLSQTAGPRQTYPNLPAGNNSNLNNNNRTRKNRLKWRNEQQNGTLKNIRGNFFKNAVANNSYSDENLEAAREEIKYRKSIPASSPAFPPQQLNSKLARIYANVSSRYNNTKQILNALRAEQNVSSNDYKKMARAHLFLYPPETRVEAQQIRNILTNLYGRFESSLILSRLPRF